MNRFKILLFAMWLLTSTVLAQSPVTLSIGTRSRTFEIPYDFAGLGFETSAEIPDTSGVSGHLFSPTNTQLITLFTNSGIRNLRVGGGTVDGLDAAVPTHADIDNLFGFAQAAGIKVIYSLRLLNGSPTAGAATAKYIWSHYQSSLDCFSIGNEPNEPPYRETPSGAITNYVEYLAAWKIFAAAVTSVVPGTKFAGPDAGGTNWVEQFASDESASGTVAFITYHEYTGGRPFINPMHDEMPASQAIDNMLSANWDTNKYPAFYTKRRVFNKPDRFPFRMTEANDYLRGVTNASDAFASALWALDFMHWWAAHGFAGVNFHNNQHETWLKTDTIYLDGPSREYRINPKAYAIRAFDLGSHGWVEPVVMGNTNGLNLTAYAVGDETNLYVTIINREHGARARNATVTISPEGLTAKNAAVMFLSSSNGDAGATSGVTLGGGTIPNDAPWDGQWTALNSMTNQPCTIIVPATSAAVVKLTTEGKNNPASGIVSAGISRQDKPE